MEYVSHIWGVSIQKRKRYTIIIILSSDMFSEHMRINNIKHFKIPLYSSWVGSVWERMIRVVKGCLYKTIGKATLTYYQLLTTISNIINVNSRPLTYRSS